jgi:hypothetical protein
LTDGSGNERFGRTWEWFAGLIFSAQWKILASAIEWLSSVIFLYAKSLQLSGFLGARHTGRLWWFHMLRGFGVPGA